MKITNKETITLLSKNIVFISFLGFISSCNSSGESKIINDKNKNLLTVNKPYLDMTESDKAVGCWTASPEKLDGTGNPRTVKGSMNYKLVFYSNGDFDDVIYFGIGFTQTDPLVNHMSGYQINNGALTYKIDGRTVSRAINVDANSIKLDGRTYIKGDCF